MMSYRVGGWSRQGGIEAGKAGRQADYILYVDLGCVPSVY